MTRNLKALGLALVAAMALSAIGAQGASAVVEHSFRSDSATGSTILTGSIETSTKDKFFPSAGSTPIECSVGTFSGTVSENPADTVTVHPKYSSCKLGNATAHVTTEGCNYIFDSDTTQATSHSTSSEHAAVSIECESTHEITVTVTGICVLHFTDESSSSPVNQSLHGVRYTNLDGSSAADAKHSSKSAITVTSTVRTIHYTATAGSFCGLGGISAGTHTTGEYEGVSSVTGYEHSANTVVTGSTTSGTTWHHSTQVNISISTPT